MAAAAAAAASSTASPADTSSPAPASLAASAKPAYRIALTALTPNNVGQLRKLNSVLFPVSYSERFYKDVVKEELEGVCQLALFNDVPVGNVCCKIEDTPSPSSGGDAPGSGKKRRRLYLMTLGVLAPYRRLGVASALLDHVLENARKPRVGAPEPVAPPSGTKEGGKEEAKKKSSAGKPGSGKTEKEREEEEEEEEEEPPVESIYLHVQTSNDTARAWYEKRGFTVIETVGNYYKRIEPASAWVLERRL